MSGTMLLIRAMKSVASQMGCDTVRPRLIYSACLWMPELRVWSHGEDPLPLTGISHTHGDTQLIRREDVRAAETKTKQIPFHERTPRASPPLRESVSFLSDCSLIIIHIPVCIPLSTMRGV